MSLNRATLTAFRPIHRQPANNYITGPAEAWRSVANQRRESGRTTCFGRDLAGSGACLVGVAVLMRSERDVFGLIGPKLFVDPFFDQLRLINVEWIRYKLQLGNVLLTTRYWL